jgi:hypothetical protein
LAALVLALAHLETAVSGFSSLKNDTELRSRAAKSKAFHLQCVKQTNYNHPPKTRNIKI